MKEDRLFIAVTWIFLIVLVLIILSLGYGAVVIYKISGLAGLLLLLAGVTIIAIVFSIILDYDDDDYDYKI